MYNFNYCRTAYSSKGNALFLILIAVALFAALSYAVTQSGRGSGNISKEQASLHLALINEYFAGVQNAMQRLTLTGCDITEISFEHPDAILNYSNASSPGDNSCHIFDPAGGGVTWQAPPSGANDVTIPEYRYTMNIPICNLAGGPFVIPNERITAYVVTTRDVCMLANEKAGIVNTGGDPPDAGVVESDIASVPYNGVWPGGGFHFGGTWHAPEIDGKRQGCFYTTWAGDNKHILYYYLHDSM